MLVMLFTIGVGNGWGTAVTGTFNKITSTDALTTGYYIIVGSEDASQKVSGETVANPNYALGNAVDNNKRVTGVSVTITSGTTISNPDEALVYLITKSSSNYTFLNVNTNTYLYQAGTTNGKGMGFKDTSANFTCAGYNGSSPTGFKFTLDGASNNIFKYNNQYTYFSNYSGSYSTSATPVRLFKAYKVTYDGNGKTGGTVPTDNVYYSSNGSTVVTVKANSSLTKTGYTFAGWNTKADGSGDNYVAGTGTFYITANTTLYAKWTVSAACDAPNAPSNSSVSSTGVTISTTSSSANYDIYYSTSSTTPTTQDPTATISSGNFKAITGLSYGTTYYYWMRQNCGGGSTSSWVDGSPASFTTTVPAPTGVSAGSITMDGATFTITDDNNVNNYDIYYSTSSTTPDAGTTPMTTSTSKTKAVSGLAAGTYYYWVRAKGPNAKSDWVGGSTFTTLTLSSISVSTAPTKVKYLEGDNFDPTALVITRTYSNSTSDTYSYAGHTGDFSFSPATNAALTVDDDAVTITYGGKSVSQAINVYTVTVNKVNMSGTAITNASVTATCSGRTLSQSVGSTNYKFNSWNVTAGGVTVSTNTITGTPTGNVTINAKFHDPITVTWLVGSSAASGGTGEVKYGTAISALPSTPADNALASCGTNKFMGWSASELTGTGNSAPADLFTTVGGASNLTTNTTYRAVFANGSGSGDAGYSKVTDSEDLTSDGRYLIVYEASSTSAIIFDGSLDPLDKSPDTIMAPISSSFITASSKLASSEFTIDMTNLYIKSASNKYINHNSGTYGNGLSSLATTTSAALQSISIDGSGNFVVFGTCHDSSNPINYVQLKYNTLAAGNPNNGSRFRFYKHTTGDTEAIRLYKYDSGTSYEDYQTSCCEAPATALSITSANSVATGGTVNLTSTGGNGGSVTWSVVNGTGSATIEGTTLTAGTVGTITVKAHQDATGSYCAQDAEQAFTVVSSTVNVTGVTVDPTTKAIVPGETFTITPTISPSNATDKSVSWSSSASDKASVSSGTVTGVAAGSATITCTTTDGSYTDETAVTVYAVTMQALDEDGNAIAVGGPGTPSRTGASISPAADAGNYVFKEWAISGASLGSSASTKANTITNPTGAVTVTAKYYKPRVVKWSVNGNDSYTAGGATTAVAYNGTITTVPSDPSGLACAGTFVAWTDATHNNGQTAEDDDSYYEDALYTDAGDFPNITAATTTFYAVFAEQDIYSGRVEVNTTNSGVSGGGYKSTTFTVDEIEFAYNNWLLNTNIQAQASNSPSLNNNEAFPRRIDKIVVKQTGTARDVTISGKNFLNSAAAEAAGKTYESASITKPSTAATMTFTFPANKSYPFFEMNTPGNAVYMDSIVIYYKEIITSNYVTECDANIVKVTYNANSGTTSCTNTTTDKTEDYTVCSTPPTRDYYTFAGWLCSADDEVYEASATIDDAVIDADFSLTAQWTPETYNITYELDGGTNNVGNPATYNVTTATITLQDPTYGHNRFDGWYGNADLSTGGVQTSIAAGSNGNKEYWAKWTARNEFKFYKDDELLATLYRASDENLEAAASGTLSGQGAKPSAPSAPSACSSKVFMGWTETWFNDETNTAPADLNDATGTRSGAKTYYAVWATRAGSPGSYTYSAYSTTCCGKSVEVDGGSPSNGTVTFDKSYAWTCKEDREIVMTITPAAGYQLHTFSVATGDGKVAAKSMSADVVLDNNSSAAQVITLTFAKDADGNYDVTATFTLMTVTSWAWTMNSAAIPDPVNLYVGQTAHFNVAYTPAGVDNSKKTYTRNKDDKYINWSGAAQATYSTISGKASTGESTTEVTFTHADGPTKTVNVKVLALPLVHFKDLIHGESFSDVVATLSDNALVATKKTPTHDDLDEPGTGNSCEKTHLHLIGWIRSDYEKVADYMAGTGAAPTVSELTGAGAGYWFLPDADINVETYNGKTFYAVWAVEE